jgi:hypothetical protein
VIYILSKINPECDTDGRVPRDKPSIRVSVYIRESVSKRTAPVFWALYFQLS